MNFNRSTNVSLAYNGWVYMKYLTTKIKNYYKPLYGISYIPCYKTFYYGRKYQKMDERVG